MASLLVGSGIARFAQYPAGGFVLPVLQKREGKERLTRRYLELPGRAEYLRWIRVHEDAQDFSWRQRLP